MVSVAATIQVPVDLEESTEVYGILRRWLSYGSCTWVVVIIFKVVRLAAEYWEEAGALSRSAAALATAMSFCLLSSASETDLKWQRMVDKVLESGWS